MGRKGEILEQLEGITPVLEAAKKAVGSIRSDHLAEIRSLSMPPEPIVDVLSAVLRLLGIQDTSWLSMKKVSVATSLPLPSTSYLLPLPSTSYLYLLPPTSTSYLLLPTSYFLPLPLPLPCGCSLHCFVLTRCRRPRAPVATVPGQPGCEGGDPGVRRASHHQLHAQGRVEDPEEQGLQLRPRHHQARQQGCGAPCCVGEGQHPVRGTTAARHAR